MKEIISNRNIITAVFGILLIGGAAALVTAYQASKNIEQSFKIVANDDDENIFV